MTEAPKRIWPVRGFAPGGYFCDCLTCRRRFMGDKRASECAECALTWFAAEHERILAEKDAQNARLLAIEDMLVKTAMLSAAVEFKNGRKAALEEAASVLRSRLDRIGLAVRTGNASNPTMCLSKIELLEEEIAAIRALAEKG